MRVPIRGFMGVFGSTGFGPYKRLRVEKALGKIDEAWGMGFRAEVGFGLTRTQGKGSRV